MKPGQNGEVVLEGENDRRYVRLGARLNGNIFFLDLLGLREGRVLEGIHGAATAAVMNEEAIWDYPDEQERWEEIRVRTDREFAEAEIPLNEDDTYFVMESLKAVTGLPRRQAMLHRIKRPIAQEMIDNYYRELKGTPAESRLAYQLLHLASLKYSDSKGLGKVFFLGDGTSVSIYTKNPEEPSFAITLADERASAGTQVILAEVKDDVTAFGASGFKDNVQLPTNALIDAAMAVSRLQPATHRETYDWGAVMNNSLRTPVLDSDGVNNVRELVAKAHTQIRK
jgi:hypothetical protein